MKAKDYLAKWNIYYKEIHLNPLCDYYFRCERMEGETTWFMVFKNMIGASRKCKVSRKEVKQKIADWNECWDAFCKDGA